MIRTTRTFRRTAGVAGALVLLAGGVAATQATGDSPQPLTRTEAALVATQAELEGTQHSVTAITLEHVIDGREVYSLTGPGTSCILTAGEHQDPGRSQSLACTNATLADPGQPLRTGFPTASGTGYVDLVWTGDDAPAQVASTGAPTQVQLGTDVVAAVRTDDSEGSALRWQAAASDPVTVELPTRAERDAQVAE